LKNNHREPCAGINLSRDHPLKGDRQGFRDLHIEPDWLLLYRVEGSDLPLARIGTHADLFDAWRTVSRHRTMAAIRHRRRARRPGGGLRGWPVSATQTVTCGNKVARPV